MRSIFVIDVVEHVVGIIDRSQFVRLSVKDVESPRIVYIIPIQFIRIAKIENLTIVTTSMIVTTKHTIKLSQVVSFISTVLGESTISSKPIQFKVTNSNFCFALLDRLHSLLFILLVNPSNESKLCTTNYMLSIVSDRDDIIILS